MPLIKSSLIVRLCLIFFALSLGACASLTKSQLNEVNTFGQLTCNFSAYPGKVVSSYNEIHTRVELFRANSLSTPEEHFKAIALADSFKTKSDLITPKIDISLQIINCYAQALIKLTADDHTERFDTASTGLGTNLEGLIGQYNRIETAHPLPTGIGSAIGQLVDLGGGLYIRTKQAEAVKKLVPEADPIIGNLCDGILAFLQTPVGGVSGGHETLQQLLENEKSELKTNYIRFLGLNRDRVTLKNSKDTIGYTGNIIKGRFASYEDDYACLKIMEDLQNTELLRKQCIAAITCLRKAHAELLKDIQEKKKLKEIVADLQYYANDIKQMNTTISAIK